MAQTVIGSGSIDRFTFLFAERAARRPIEHAADFVLTEKDRSVVDLPSAVTPSCFTLK